MTTPVSPATWWLAYEAGLPNSAWFITVILGVFLFGAVNLLWHIKDPAALREMLKGRPPEAEAQAHALFFIVFVCVLVLVVPIAVSSPYLRMRSAVAGGRTRVVEGAVTGWTASHRRGGTGWISVDGQRFTFEDRAGFIDAMLEPDARDPQALEVGRRVRVTFVPPEPRSTDTAEDDAGMAVRIEVARQG